MAMSVDGGDKESTLLRQKVEVRASVFVSSGRFLIITCAMCADGGSGVVCVPVSVFVPLSADAGRKLQAIGGGRPALRTQESEQEPTQYTER
jgi:hypothetical protein